MAQPISAAATGAFVSGDSDRADCAVVVVTYNSAADIDRLIGSLRAAATAMRVRLIVVDNASSDDTTQLVVQQDDILLIKAPGNVGYAAGINLARVRKPAGEPLVVLNPDLVVGQQTLSELLAPLADKTIGAVVPLIRDSSGHRYGSLRREPSIGRALADCVALHRAPGRLAEFGEPVVDPSAYSVPHDIDWATGAAIVVSAECDAVVGEWDERFFLYSEETDYCRRIRSAGWRVRFQPTAVVTHRGAGSGTSNRLGALMAVNRIRYFEKHNNRVHTTLFRMVVIGHEALRSPLSSAHRTALRAVSARRTWPALSHG